ncbi:hypothetical protein D3C80_1168800 [compost metagenome]
MPPSGKMFTRRWVQASRLVDSSRWWLFGPSALGGRISLQFAACRASSASLALTQASMDTAGG